MDIDEPVPSTVQIDESKVTVSLIISFCCLGAVTRAGLGLATSSVESYGALPIYTAFFANLVGCWCIGLFAQLKSSPFKAALTTGFCGCLTTYSGWNSQQAIALVNFKLKNIFQVF